MKTIELSASGSSRRLLRNETKATALKIYLGTLVACLALARVSCAQTYWAYSLPSSTIVGELGTTLTSVQTSTTTFGLYGNTNLGAGTLTCDVFEGNGPPGQPFYYYRYQIEAASLPALSGHQLGFDLLDGNDPMGWFWVGATNNIALVSQSDTSGGGVGVFFAVELGGDLRFSFNNALVPGVNSLNFGFISRAAPQTVQAEVVDYDGIFTFPYDLQTLGPSWCPIYENCVQQPIINPSLILQAVLYNNANANGGSNGLPSNGMYSMQFQLFDSPTNGNVVSGVLTQQVNVANGLFSVPLDFGANSFHPPSPCYLDVAISTPGSTGGVVHLAPRLTLGMAPYAAHASEADSVATLGAGQAVTSLNGLQDNVMLLAGANVSITPTNSNMLMISAASAAPDSITPAQLAAPEPMDGEVLIYTNGVFDWIEPLTLTCACPAGWLLKGNAGTSPGLDFVGTTDNQALDLDSDSERGLQLQYVTGTRNFAAEYAMNVLGGYWGNTIASGVLGGTIAGGGELYVFTSPGISVPNIVTNDFGTIGGGLGNMIGGNSAVIAGGAYNTNLTTYGGIGGGDLNFVQTNAFYSMIGGGYSNTIGGVAVGSSIVGGYQNSIGDSGVNGLYGAIGGGYQNSISNGSYCVVGGGINNQAGIASTIGRQAIQGATISGGSRNTASSIGATVPGGTGNLAGGLNSFAAGSGAQAINDYSFVWSDGGSIFGNVANYSSSADGQFMVHADGGVQFDATNGVVMNVAGSSGLNPAALYVNSTSANGVGMYIAQASTDSSLVLANSRASGELIKGFGPNSVQVFQLDTEGEVTFGNSSYGNNDQVSWQLGQGGWSFSCDRNLKDRFEPVNPALVLDKVVRLPLSEWSYKGRPQRHIGPVAQDFHALFPLNNDDKSINDLDLHGVALAAIQGLNQKLQEKDAEIDALKQRVAALEREMNGRLAALEDALGARHAGDVQAVSTSYRTGADR